MPYRAMGNDLILCVFRRPKVERGDFSHFLSLYAPDKLPTGSRLRAMMGSFVFGVDGYDADPREVHIIPEVRKFYAAFHEAWPYWLYFCNLDQDGLKMMTCCCLKSFTAIKVDGQPKCGVQFDPLELLRLISRDFAPMNVMCDRAGMFERRIYERSKAIFEYFGFPFSAPAPD